MALEVRLDGAPAAHCALCVGLRARAATRNRRPTSRLLFAQSAVVGASQLMAVNRARLSSRQTSASRALSPAEVDAARDLLSRADATMTAKSASLDATIEEKEGQNVARESRVRQLRFALNRSATCAPGCTPRHYRARQIARPPRVPRSRKRARLADMVAWKEDARGKPPSVGRRRRPIARRATLRSAV